MIRWVWKPEERKLSEKRVSEKSKCKWDTALPRSLYSMFEKNTKLNNINLTILWPLQFRSLKLNKKTVKKPSLISLLPVITLSTSFACISLKLETLHVFCQRYCNPCLFSLFHFTCQSLIRSDMLLCDTQTGSSEKHRFLIFICF